MDAVGSANELVDSDAAERAFDGLMSRQAGRQAGGAPGHV